MLIITIFSHSFDLLDFYRLFLYNKRMSNNREQGLSIYPATGQQLPVYPELQAVRSRFLQGEHIIQNLSLEFVQKELQKQFEYILPQEIITKLSLNSKNWSCAFQERDLPIIFAQFQDGMENLNSASALVVINRAIRNNTVVATSLAVSGIAEMDEGDIPRVLSVSYGPNGYLHTIQVGVYDDEFPDPHPAPNIVLDPTRFKPYAPEVMQQIQEYNQVMRPFPTPIDAQTSNVITSEMTNYNSRLKALHLFFPSLGDEDIPFKFGMPYVTEYPSRWGNQYMQGQGYGVLLDGNNMHVSRMRGTEGDWHIAIPISLEHLPPVDQS